MASTRAPVVLLFMLFVACNCSPIKSNSPDEGATDECYGTQCYYDDLDTTVSVNFPENFTEAILLALPRIEGSQSETVILLNKTLISQEKVADLLEHNLQKIEASQSERLRSNNKTLVSQEKVANMLEDRLERIETSITNMTATMTELMGHMANLLQNQLDVLGGAPSIEVQHGQTTTQSTILPPYAQDCQDLASSGIERSGPYIISPDGLGSFEVYCDFTDNEGWTVIQKRFDGSVDFYRNWTEYEEGFGDTSGEYWLGLKNIRRLSSEGITQALKIDLESFDGETAYAVYDSFGISDAASNYRLSVGEYSGNAGDSLKYNRDTGTGVHNGMNFTTYDRDNDLSDDTSNCAVRYKGGWWYNSCYKANLNGVYQAPNGLSDYTRMIWYTFKLWESIKSSQMKVRPGRE